MKSLSKNFYKVSANGNIAWILTHRSDRLQSWKGTLTASFPTKDWSRS